MLLENLRVLTAAPARSPRCQTDARRVAARLTYLRRVTCSPVLIVPPGAADRAPGADADVLYICTHSYPGPQPEGFLDTDLTALHQPLTANALILDTCWGAARAVRRTLAALRPARLPPLALLAPTDQAPFDHHVLAGPLFEASSPDHEPAHGQSGSPRRRPPLWPLPNWPHTPGEIGRGGRSTPSPEPAPLDCRRGSRRSDTRWSPHGQADHTRSSGHVVWGCDSRVSRETSSSQPFSSRCSGTLHWSLRCHRRAGSR